ncbi:MAG: beta-lactamase family protein [Gemmatimonadetes bacterium]|nr:beta-lactamase family protein [Gemmatimonadota bacterium]
MRRPMALSLLILASWLVQATPARAQEAVATRVDAVFAEWDRPDSPGCAVGVIQDGNLLYTRGYGSANLDYQLPNAPTMVYYMGSVSKQFTAAVIALLVQEARITLDDDVRRHIPELPDYGRTMTIRHLVHHTSGLRDIYTLMSLAGIRMEDVLTDEDALRLIVRQKALNFLPGDDYLYSNSGYWLLGQIVERVTGESLREAAQQRIFGPLGMRDTHFHDEPAHILRNRAVSYAPDRDGYRIAYLGNFDKVGAGGLYTTIADLQKWDANFYEPRIGGDAFLEMIHTRGVLARGDTLDYAFGLTIGDYRGLETVRHSGSLMGFRADLVRFPAERFTVVVQCNAGNIDATGLANRVADALLEDRLTPAPSGEAPPAGARNPPQPGAAATAPADLTAFTGEFSSEELDVTYRIERVDQGLVLERRMHGAQPLQPLGDDAFRAADVRLRFARDAAGRITGFSVDAGRVRNIRFDRR